MEQKTPASPRRRIGLIAGNGLFPFLFSRAAHSKNLEIIAVAFYGETNPKLKQCVDKIYWIRVGELKKLLGVFHEERITEAVMAGQIKHTVLFRQFEIDEDLKNLLDAIKDKKTDTILGSIAGWLKNNGIALINSTTFLDDYMPGEGVRTEVCPTDRDWADISFGVNMARYLGQADIGQTVVVKDKVVLAVEAIDGTDQTIMRGGRLGGPGAVVIKMSKPKQDMRFDVPVIGPRTIQTMARIKARVLAYEANKTIILDSPLCLRLAGRHKICIVGVK